MAGSSSAGTIKVHVGADVSGVTAGMQKGGEELARFRQRVERESTAVSAAGEKMGRGFRVSGGEISKSVRAGVAGLALLSQAGSGVAGDLSRLAGGIATGFAVGGPAGAAIAGIAEGFNFVARRISGAREETEKFARAQAEAAAKAREVAAEKKAAHDKAIGEERSAMAEEIVRERKWRTDASVRNAKEESEIRQRNEAADAQRFAEHLDRIEKERQKRAAADKEALERFKDRREREREAAAQINQQFDRQIELLRARDDIERTRARQRHEVEDASQSPGVNVDKLRVSHALELNDLLAKQAQHAADVAANEGRAAVAEIERVKAVKDIAAAEAARKRQQHDDQYRAGYGPIAQRRDAARAERNRARLQRHEDNINAERRESSAYGIVSESFAPVGYSAKPKEEGTIYEGNLNKKVGYVGVPVPGVGAGGGAGSGVAPKAFPTVTPPNPAPTDNGAGNLPAAGAAVKAGGDAVRQSGEAVAQAAADFAAGAAGINSGAEANVKFAEVTTAKMEEVAATQNAVAEAVAALTARVEMIEVASLI
jgi:hypothetical protein